MDLQCDSAHKLQNKLDHLRSLLNDPYIFKCVYRYSYDFARVSANVFYLNKHVCIDILIICMMMYVIIGISVCHVLSRHR